MNQGWLGYKMSKYESGLDRIYQVGKDESGLGRIYQVE